MKHTDLFSREGYLRENYHYFHLRDTAGQERDFHFHEFDKAVILLSGKVDYAVEDMTYTLKPWDVLLVKHHTIHKALIDQTEPYERVIIYLDRHYFDQLMPQAQLLKCFDTADRKRQYLFTPNSEQQKDLGAALNTYEQAAAETEFGAQAMRDSVMIQLLIRINRISISGQARTAKGEAGMEKGKDAAGKGRAGAEKSENGAEKGKDAAGKGRAGAEKSEAENGKGKAKARKGRAENGKSNTNNGKAKAEDGNDEAQTDSRIASALSYINENLTRELDVGEIAERVFLSRYHFMRLFKAQTGITVHAYIRQKRLLYASRLIREGMPAAEAASKCGFSDYSGFHRAFKDCFGVSPGQLKGQRRVHS
ncbi:MAG: helix-turn-helix domain-containing protein [Lachnospiraceae bacterium]|nr:helix-turn-helix domain-containing protein [Lachnospiraceae bacterium]